MSHHVRLEDSEDDFVVEDKEYVLEAALRQGLALPYGCQSGGCGACRVKLIDGALRYEDDCPPPALSSQEQAAGYALICTAYANSDLVLNIEQLPDEHPIRVRNLPARIIRMEQLCHDVMQVNLVLPGNEKLDYLAGQYIDIILRNGERRSFSIANAPGNQHELELHVRHVPGGQFTESVFSDLKEKSLLRFEGPIGNFYRRDSDRPTLMVAGGTGFAPIKAMLEEFIASRSSQPMHIYWGARAKQDLYLNTLIEEWRRSRPNLRYTPVLSEPTAQDNWQGRTGWVHQAILDDHQDLSGHDVYLSGPPPMINAAKETFFARGLNPDNLHYDSFDYFWALSNPS